MKPSWILERGVFLEGNPDRMKQLIVSGGMECIEIQEAPIRSMGYLLILEDRQALLVKSLLPPPETRVIVYGSIRLAHDLKGMWIPTVWANSENFSCRTYLARWTRHVLQQDYVIIPFGEFASKAAELLERHGVNRSVFVRPDENLKHFEAKVILESEFESFLRQSIADETRVLVARPRALVCEWRFVIWRGAVVTGSRYSQERQLSLGPAEPEARQAAEIVARDPWQPEPIYVLDIGKTDQGEYRVVEINSINCSGLYACDLEKVVAAMSQEAAE